MRSRITQLLTAGSLLFSHAAHADIIVLKSGEKLDGRVVREDDTHYVVEVRVSASIRDEKRIARADVQRIEKEPEDEKAFAGLASLVPAPDLLSAEGYKQRIEKLEAFLKDHPASSRSAEVKGMLETLKSEMESISSGTVKFGGRLIGADEFSANAYDLESRIAEKKIRDAVSRRDLVGALRLFDEYEASFGESQGRAGLAALMMQVLGAYRQGVAESLATLEGRIKDREAGLARMTPDDRARSERAIREEGERAAKRFAGEKEARMKWVTPDEFHKESLEEAQRQIASELTRLESTAPAPEIPLAEVYKAAWEKLSGGTEEEKKAVIEDAKAKRLPETYLAKLRARAGIAAP